MIGDERFSSRSLSTRSPRSWNGEGGADGCYHWRDRNRHEVDLVVELGGRFVTIEIKRTSEVPRKAAAGIEAFRTRYPRQFERGLVAPANTPHLEVLRRRSEEHTSELQSH